MKEVSEVEAEAEEISRAGNPSPNPEDPPPIKVFPRRRGGPSSPAGRRKSLEKVRRRTKRKQMLKRKLAEAREGRETTETK